MPRHFPHWLSKRDELDDLLYEPLIRHYLYYDPETGILLWKRAPLRKPNLLGMPAGGFRKDGYLTLKLYGRLFLGHRIAWFLMMGEWPINVVDHIDRDPSNNAWDNLQDITQRENSQRPYRKIKKT